MVDSAGFENRYTERYREFESLRLRQRKRALAFAGALELFTQVILEEQELSQDGLSRCGSRGSEVSRHEPERLAHRRFQPEMARNLLNGGESAGESSQ